MYHPNPWPRSRGHTLTSDSCSFRFSSLFSRLLSYSSSTFFLLAQVYQSNLIHYPNITHPHGLVTTILGLQVVLDGSHFKNGSMRVKCLTSVSPVLSMSSSSSGTSSSGTDGVNGGINNGRISYVQRRPLLDNREAMLLGMCFVFNVHCVKCVFVLISQMVTPTSCLSLFGSIFSFVFFFFFCCWWWWSLWPLSFSFVMGRAVYLIIFCLRFSRFDTHFIWWPFCFYYIGYGQRKREENIEREKRRAADRVWSLWTTGCPAIATKSTLVRLAHPFLCKHTNINRHLSNLVRTRRKPPPPTLLCWTQAHKFWALPTQTAWQQQ